MNIDLNKLVDLANQSLQNEPGFLHCSVESHPERLLAYEFSDTTNAHAFQAKYELLGLQAAIPNARQTTVVVKHP
ncbi:hypothetical protein [Acidovorax sp.]|uniref:hypothetical protein n=1 Tax=Acidovorax sp. TaxID=1872122 RepID=UPI00391EE3EE